jgi:hypothetical protein
MVVMSAESVTFTAVPTSDWDPMIYRVRMEHSGISHQDFMEKVYGLVGSLAAFPETSLTDAMSDWEATGRLRIEETEEAQYQIYRK